MNIDTITLDLVSATCFGTIIKITVKKLFLKDLFICAIGVSRGAAGNAVSGTIKDGASVNAPGSATLSAGITKFDELTAILKKAVPGVTKVTLHYEAQLLMIVDIDAF